MLKIPSFEDTISENTSATDTSFEDTSYEYNSANDAISEEFADGKFCFKEDDIRFNTFFFTELTYHLQPYKITHSFWCMLNT